MTDTNNLGAPDLELDGAMYVQGATEEAGKRNRAYVQPPPGLYTVQLPRNFEVRETTDRFTKEPCIEILLGTSNGRDSEGLTIVGGNFDGHVIKFIRVTNVNRDKWEEIDGKRVKTGKTSFNDAHDILAGLGCQRLPQTADEFRAAFAEYAGAVTRYPWHFNWQGKAVANLNARGYATYIKGKQFNQRDAQGNLLSYVEKEATHPATIKIRREDTTIQPGDKYRVYANLVLSSGGAAPRKS